MNYKVMQRPMFKMGGKANSQGTGITSGLDEKVNMVNGRANYANGPDLSGMSISDLLSMQQANQAKQLSGLDAMRDIVRLQALGNLAGNVLPNVERGGLKGVTDFLKDPMTTQTAIQGLTGLKKVDLQEGKIRGEGLDKYIKGRMGLEQLDIARDKANKELDREIRLRLGNEAQQLLDSVGGDINALNPSQKAEFERKMKISMGSGFLTENEAKAQAYAIAAKIYDPESIGNKKFMEEVEKIASSLYYGGGNAYGGTPNRVERQMGSPMGGEQPLPEDPTKPVNPFQPKPIGPFPSKAGNMDAKMETEGQGDNVFAMLRARLPQEITDEVVSLIAYNKEAFADFASIKNQEDVNSFNEKYGVELVIDVATV